MLILKAHANLIGVDSSKGFVARHKIGVQELFEKDDTWLVSYHGRLYFTMAYNILEEVL